MIFDLLVLVRGVHFAATLWAAGTVGFIVLVAGPALRSDAGPLALRRLSAMAWAALLLTGLSGLAWLAVIAANILEVPLASLGAREVWTVCTDTRFGQIAGLRLGLAAGLGVLLAAPGFPGRASLQLTAAAALAGLLAAVGHAGATPGPAGWLHLTSDVAHILAAAAWLGGLPALAMTLSAPGAVAITGRFSVLGVVSVGTLLLSGAINSWQLLGGPGDLTTTTYGRILAAKIILFAAMLGFATANRFWLTPRLPAAAALRTLRRNSLIEAGLGVGVVMLVGALGTMVPGGHVHTNEAPSQSEAAFVHIHTEAVMADVTIDPGQTRNNTATVRLSREDSSPYPARSVMLMLEPRGGGAEKLENTAFLAADGTWQVDRLAIPHPGVWILRLTIVAANGASTVLDAPIVIAQCSNECW